MAKSNLISLKNLDRRGEGREVYQSIVSENENFNESVLESYLSFTRP
jgi:hypothetical protein